MGRINAGDTVGVYLSFSPANSTSSVGTTQLVFQHVLVTNVQTTNTPVSQKNGDQVQQVSATNYIVTLALTPTQSKRFVFAAEFGHIWLSNDPSSVAADGTGLINLGNVYHGGEAMMTETRPYIVGHDLTADQLAAIEGLGIDIKVNGGPPPEPRTCRVIVVFSPKGGSGKTVVASNLAAALALRFPGRVVAVDLDVQFGDLATALAVQPEHTLAQLARTPTFDATTVKLFLTPFDGMFLLAGTDSPEEADLINHSHVTAVLPLLAQNFDYVIVDTPAGLDERTLAALECATDLLLVSSLDVPSIRNLRKALDTLDKIGVKADRQFILNKADDKVGLGLKDAEEAIGMKVTGEIPSTHDIPLSVNVGVPIVLKEPRSTAARQLQLVSQLYAPIEVDKPKRGWRR